MHNGFPRQHTFYGEKKHICYTSNNIQNPRGAAISFKPWE